MEAANLQQEEKNTMTTLLEYREKLKLFLSKYDTYIYPVLKFLLALTVFLLMNENIGFMKQLKSPAIAFVLALMCSFLPVNMIAIFGALLLLGHCYALSLEIFLIAFVLLALMFLLFFRTAPGYGYVLVMTPLAFTLKIPYVVPLAMGLAGTPAAAVPVACGTIVYYLMHYMRLNTTILSGTEASTVTEKVTYLVDNVINNKEMLLTVAAFALTLIIVYVIRRMSVDHAWTVAIIVGTVTDFVVLLTGSLILGIAPKIIAIVVGSLISAGLAFLLQLVIFSLDYSRTEYVQFEDDEYYYYVKAVPKITIAVSEKTVKKISTQKKPAARKKSTAARRQTGHTQRPVRSEQSGHARRPVRSEQTGHSQRTARSEQPRRGRDD